MKIKNKQTIMIICGISFVFLMTLGCMDRKKGVKDLNFEKWKAMSETAKGHTPAPLTPDSPSKAELKSAEAEKPPPPFAEAEKFLPVIKVGLNMQDVDISVMLKTLAKAANVNMIINHNVKGKATIHVSESRWDEVFSSILRSHNLNYVWDGDILRIISLEDVNDEVKLSEADIKKKLQKQKSKQADPLLTEVIKVNFANAEELKKSFEPLMKGDDGDKQKAAISVDIHTGSLIVRARADDIEMIKNLTRKIDRPTSQVLIEAHIVEATRQTAYELGVQWGGAYKGSKYQIGPNAATNLTSSKQSSDKTTGGVFDTSVVPEMALTLPGSITASEGLNIGAMIQRAGSNVLAVQLSALQNNGQLKILSSPSITTLDNQTATIESGKEVPFQTVQQGEVNVEFKKAVLSLKVTPHVIDGKILKLNILTHKDELDFTNNVAGNPTIITKNAETNVVLFDGQTTVIGGLNKESLSDSESGIPILSDIPLIGHLFKRTGNKSDREEILIFITPHLLKEPQP